MFENHLKLCFPHRQHINYDVSELFAYIDSLGDLTCLTLQVHCFSFFFFSFSTIQSFLLIFFPTHTHTQPASGLYIPYNREWIKDRIFQSLQRQAMRG